LTKDRANGIGGKEPDLDWNAINWQLVERRVKNLRQRIFRAVQSQKWNEVRSLMKLMLRSFSNLLSSVRRATQLNQGKKTPGIDQQVALGAKARARVVRQMLEYQMWKAAPAKRVYIPKSGGKTRPLGIPTLKNRVAQGVVKNALEPFWEARFEANSYGFRPGRSCHDAIEHCFRFLNKRSRSRWILDADIKAAFDMIDHDFVLSKIGCVPGRGLIKRWLKAGYVEGGILHATEYGVPQGGVISPLLANIALDGLQEVVGKKFGFVRYADDFIITAEDRSALESLVPTINSWLSRRGLELNTDKTRIVHISDGFNFLGFNVRQYSNKCIIKPQMEKVRLFLRSIRQWLKANAGTTALEVILNLNPRIVGWAHYYRHAVSSRTFGYVKTKIWKALWQWCLRRHNNKGKGWVRRKYFTAYQGKEWKFFARFKDRDGIEMNLFLEDIAEIRITRHVKVRGAASPDDPALSEYWADRRLPQGRMRTANRSNVRFIDAAPKA